MTKDAWISLLVKILLMVLTPLAAQMHINDGATLTAFSTDIADAIVLLYGMYAQWNMKRVKKDAVVVQTPTPSPVIGTTVTGKVVSVLLAAFALSLLFPHASRAGDIAGPAAISKALTSGYPTHCGFYYGVGTGGNAGAVNGANVGTQIVQGDIDAMVGYSCPFAGNGFWFAEAQGGISNLNGSTNGLALSGPAVFIERFGAGSPINSLLGSLFPTSNLPSLPSIPLLPTGITQSPGNSYAFAGLVEQDIGSQIGALSGHQWVVAPLVGLGLLTRLSNNVMADTWAGWQMNSNSFCPGGGSACAKLGNMARIGVAFKY